MVEKKKFYQVNVLEMKLRSENYIFLKERKKWRNFQCKNVWKNEKTHGKKDKFWVVSPINGRRASELIFNVKMFGNFFEIQPSSAFSSFLSGPSI